MGRVLGLCLLLLCVLASLASAYDSDPHIQMRNGMRINRRGFKSSLLSTARGFGKRSDPSLAAPEPQDYRYNPRVLAYILNNLDEDGDGILSADEINNIL